MGSNHSVRKQDGQLPCPNSCGVEGDPRRSRWRVKHFQWRGCCGKAARTQYLPLCCGVSVYADAASINPEGSAQQ